MATSEPVEGNVVLIRGSNGEKGQYAYRRTISKYIDNTGREFTKDIRKRLGTNLLKALAKARELDAECDALKRGETLLLSTPIGDYAEWYYGYIEKVAVSKFNPNPGLLGWKTIRGNIRVFVQHVGANLPIGKIGPLTIKGFLEMRKGKAEKSTVHGSLRDLRRLFNVALEKGHLKVNPCQGITVEKGLDKEPRLPTREEVQRLLGFLEANDPSMHGVVLALIFTAARLTEILTLDWFKVDCMNRKLTLVRRKIKDELTLDIAEPLRKHLESLWNSRNMPIRGLVFPNPETGELDNRNLIYRRFKKVVDRLGLGWLTLKIFRKYAATLVQEATGNIRDAQMLLGHGDSKTTEVYLRGGNAAARVRAVKALETSIGSDFGNFLGNSPTDETQKI